MVEKKIAYFCKIFVYLEEESDLSLLIIIFMVVENRTIKQITKIVYFYFIYFFQLLDCLSSK